MIYMYLFLGLPVLTALLRMATAKKPLGKECVLEIWISHLLFWGVGMAGIFGFLANTFDFLGSWVSDSLGWRTGTEFQKDLGIALLAMGVLGINCLIFHGGFWLATVLFAVVFGVGEAWLIFLSDVAMKLKVWVLVYNVIGAGILAGLLALYYFIVPHDRFWSSCCCCWSKKKKARK